MSDSSPKEIALFNVMLQHLSEHKVMTHYEVEELLKSPLLHSTQTSAGGDGEGEEGQGEAKESPPAQTQGTQAAAISFKGTELTAALAKLETGGWLTRSGARGYWELGMRTWLELKPVVLAARAGRGKGGGEERDEEGAEADMPHVIVY